jgi:hypothetical protein
MHREWTDLIEWLMQLHDQDITLTNSASHVVAHGKLGEIEYIDVPKKGVRVQIDGRFFPVPGWYFVRLRILGGQYPMMYFGDGSLLGPTTAVNDELNSLLASAEASEEAPPPAPEADHPTHQLPVPPFG